MTQDINQIIWAGKECWHKMSAFELYNQIKLRKHLQKQMIGDLYPGILENEIKEILATIEQIKLCADVPNK